MMEPRIVSVVLRVISLMRPLLFFLRLPRIEYMKGPTLVSMISSRLVSMMESRCISTMGHRIISEVVQAYLNNGAHVCLSEKDRLASIR